MDPKISQCSIVNVNDSAALPKTFTFDGVYYTDSTTEQIYNEIAYPLVEVCISIYYLCIRGIVRDPTTKFKAGKVRKNIFQYFWKQWWKL